MKKIVRLIVELGLLIVFDFHHVIEKKQLIQGLMMISRFRKKRISR